MIKPHSDQVYRGEIDQIIRFYKARLYLRDSEYKILSDIAGDAEKIIGFLEDRKNHLVAEMKQNKIDSKTSEIRGFLLHKARYSC